MNSSFLSAFRKLVKSRDRVPENIKIDNIIPQLYNYRILTKLLYTKAVTENFLVLGNIKK